MVAIYLLLTSLQTENGSNNKAQQRSFGGGTATKTFGAKTKHTQQAVE
jgi:hypothetical protein